MSKSISKFLALILRHEPAKFGLKLDSEGFSDLDPVWQAVNKHYKGKVTTKEFLDTLESPGGKQRFEVVNGRIRALYGHSYQDVEYPPAVPPDILYHGTTPEAWALIREEGIKAQKRQYVHLSTHLERASSVASRHGKPIILNIRALDAHHAGHAFYNPEPQHYLVKFIPPEFIEQTE
jgi:putative RNA 2'-phosphotransferase